MTIQNSELINPEQQLFSVLGLVSLRLPSQYSWQGQDIDDVNCKGSYFGAFEQDQMKVGGIAVASFTVVDATNDATEPDVSTLEQADVQAIDDRLHEDTKSQLPMQGMSLVRWMSSHLNESENLKGLVTAYIAQQHDREWQNIALRFNAKGRKVVVIGAFDIARKEALAAPIFGVIRNMMVLE